jgi:ketosteroid isomerase-like protein
MTQHAALALLRQWCDAVARRDIEAALGLCDEELVVLAPFVPAPIPSRMVGRAAFAAPFGQVTALFAAFRWAALDLQAAADPALAFGTASAAITLVDGRPYTQDFVFIVRERAGRIISYTEYMDPIRARVALAPFAPNAPAEPVA